MRAIIPVAGIGRRLRPHTHTQPKVLIPVAGKAILQHILDELVGLGITQISLITGHLADKVRQFVSAHYRIKVEYYVQEKLEGLAHAIWLARDGVRMDEPVLIILGDTIFKADLSSIIGSEVSYIGQRGRNEE